jgi:hypothetical protein
MALLLFQAGVAEGAAPSGVAMNAGVEWFNWHEYDDAGARLLQESGPRWFAGAMFGNKETEKAQGLLYAAEARVYTGVVDYESSGGMSETDYQGGRAAVVAGYRWDGVWPGYSVDALGGAGIERWTRDILNNSSLSVSNMNETYRVAYAVLDAGVGHAAKGWRYRWDIGVKQPFDTSEQVDLMSLGYDRDVTLSPGRSLSGFARARFERDNDSKPGRCSITVYYDGYRFAKSDVKVVTAAGVPRAVWQPESRMDVFGVSVEFPF